MNQHPKTPRKTKTKKRVENRDLKVKKDVKGGENITFTYTKPSVEYKQQ
jgi:hypothetical protein